MLTMSGMAPTDAYGSKAEARSSKRSVKKAPIRHKFLDFYQMYK